MSVLISQMSHYYWFELGFTVLLSLSQPPTGRYGSRSSRPAISDASFTVEARSRCLQRGRRCWGHRRPLCARHFHNSAAKVKWTQNTEENMARRINLLLVRHALSGANLDKSLNYRLPDQRIPLAEVGHDQAAKAGEFLAGFLSETAQSAGRTRILCSPYLRARQTSAGIESVLRDRQIEFDKREEIALREISFGLFDGYADDELQEHFPLEHSRSEERRVGKACVHTFRSRCAPSH